MMYSNTQSTPPQTPQEHSHWRLPPEFAPQAVVMIAWPHDNTDWTSMLNAAEKNCATLIAAISVTATPWVLIPNECIKKQITQMISTALINNGWRQYFDIEFSICQYNDTWTRDYGPLCTFKKSEHINQKHLRIQDFLFNGWGNKFNADQDNKVNQYLWDSGEFQRVYISKLDQDKLCSVQFQSYDWILEGGSLETNGQILLSTTACLLNTNRNPTLDQSNIEKRLIQHFGIKQTLWLTEGHLEGDDTDAHIDTLARFINHNTIAYQGCQDENDTHFHPLRQMKQQLEAIATEHNLTLIELPWPTAQFEGTHRLPATYANFLIINQHLLLPTYGCPQDQQALNSIATAFPNISIMPIDCQTLIRNNGSLHCSTMQLPHLWSE